ncbi:MAG: hypothetical protein NDJ89_10710 [Oligoflexia bacterium]|nr:hypothetical protein [Oligoflexia bacterium]
MLLLKIALRPWRLAAFSQVFSSIAVGFLLLLAGFMYWMQSGLKPVLERLRAEQVITAYVAHDAEAAIQASVVDSIRLTLGAHPAEVKVVEPKDFVANLKSQFPDLGRELEDLGPEMEHVVPRYVSVSGVLPDSMLAEIRAVPGIESAESSKDRYHHVLGAFSALRWVARLLAGGLCLALLTGLIHLARSNAYLHRDALALMRLWGANEGILRVPGILSGLAVGWLGGLLACMGWITGGAWLARNIRSLSPMLRDMPLFTGELAWLLLAAGGLIGIVAGIFGGIAGSAAAAARPGQGR